jgi:hypothetical protein
LESGRLKRHKASAAEIGKLFDVVKRDLARPDRSSSGSSAVTAN